MRFYEFKNIKPIKPLSPEQARVSALKKNVASAKQQLRTEKGNDIAAACGQLRRRVKNTPAA